MYDIDVYDMCPDPGEGRPLQWFTECCDWTQAPGDQVPLHVLLVSYLSWEDWHLSEESFREWYAFWRACCNGLDIWEFNTCFGVGRTSRPAPLNIVISGIRLRR